MKEKEENKLHISDILEGNTFYSNPICLIILFSPNKADFTYCQGFALNNIAKIFFKAVLSSEAPMDFYWSYALLALWKSGP